MNVLSSGHQVWAFGNASSCLQFITCQHPNLENNRSLWTSVVWFYFCKVRLCAQVSMPHTQDSHIGLRRSKPRAYCVEWRNEMQSPHWPFKWRKFWHRVRYKGQMLYNPTYMRRGVHRASRWHRPSAGRWCSKGTMGSQTNQNVLISKCYLSIKKLHTHGQHNVRG